MVNWKRQRYLKYCRKNEGRKARCVKVMGRRKAKGRDRGEETEACAGKATWGEILEWK